MTAVTETGDAIETHSTAAPAPSFLTGETIYLRGVQLSDARWATAWRGSLFPITAEKAEEALKEEVPKQNEQGKYRLIACRRSDGRPVGAVKLNDEEALNAELTLTSDPAMGGQGPELQAEMLRLVVPWLSTERKRPVVRVMTDVDMQPVVSAAKSLGMDPAVQLRDGVWRQGRLRDGIFYELLHPVWTSRLGDPGPGLAEAGAPVLHPTSPAPRRDPSERLALPDNAMIGSKRLALRPFQPEDAGPVSASTLTETDTSFGHSRFPYSAILLADWFGEMSENDPASDFEVAVVHRETGELVGEVGLYSIDWQARTAESGWWLYRAEDRGHGYGTEANHLLLEYAFDHLGLNMIWAWVKARNPRSQAGLRKQGYRDAGRFTWTGFGPDGFEDALMFDILAGEWRAARDGG